MPYTIAGIDVHKKVLMVAVADMNAPQGGPALRAPAFWCHQQRTTSSGALVSSAFGGRGCSVHSPSTDRPGTVSTNLMAAFSCAGFALAVCGSSVQDRQVIEVYPHIAVMRLLNESYRVPYKTQRAHKYWKEATPPQRRKHISTNFARILSALQEYISDIPLLLPPPGAGPAELKRFEDALDGVVCAWIGTQYLEGQCEAYGDETASIWVPSGGQRPTTIPCHPQEDRPSPLHAAPVENRCERPRLTRKAEQGKKRRA